MIDPHFYSRKGLSRSDNVNRHEDNCFYNPDNNQSPLSLPSRHSLRQTSSATTSAAMATIPAVRTRRAIASSSSVRASAAPGSPPRTRSSGRALVRLPGPSVSSPALNADNLPNPCAGLSSSSSITPTSLALRTLPMRRARNRVHPYFPPSHS